MSGPRRTGLREDQVQFETTKGVEVVATFDQMNFKEDLIRGIYAYGT
jgi:ATP-dependent RNA helicase